MLNPLKPPSPPDYGYINSMPIQQTQVDLPQMQPVKLPELQIPDVVRAMHGAGDKNMVGALLKAAAGEDSGLIGVSPTFAASLLGKMGYPTNADDWSPDQWQQSIDANAMKPNLLTILESLR